MRSSPLFNQRSRSVTLSTVRGDSLKLTKKRTHKKKLVKRTRCTVLDTFVSCFGAGLSLRFRGHNLDSRVNLLCVRAGAHVRGLMARKSFAVGMRNTMFL